MNENIDIDLCELNKLYSRLIDYDTYKNCGIGFKYHIFYDVYKNFFFNEKLFINLYKLNVVKDYYKGGIIRYIGVTEIKEPYCDLDIHKVKFIIDFENKINNGGIQKVYDYEGKYIEDIIVNIEKIGFEKIYRNIGLKTEYKIKDVIYFVHYIFYIGEKNIIEILENYLKENNNNEIKNKIESYKINNGYIRTNLGDIVLSPIENNILKILKSKINDGGVSLSNLKTITNQISGKSVQQSIKLLKTKIKNNNLDNFIKIFYNRAEKTYNLKLESMK